MIDAPVYNLIQDMLALKGSVSLLELAAFTEMDHTLLRRVLVKNKDLLTWDTGVNRITYVRDRKPPETRSFEACAAIATTGPWYFVWHEGPDVGTWFNSPSQQKPLIPVNIDKPSEEVTATWHRVQSDCIGGKGTLVRCSCDLEVTRDLRRLGFMSLAEAGPQPDDIVWKE